MYQKIMVPLDGSELAECVLPHVERIASGYACEVVLVRAVEPFRVYEGIESGIHPEERKRLDKEGVEAARRYLEGVKTKLSGKKYSIKTEVIFGKAVDALVDYANKNGVDLVITASHGRSGVSRWMLGSVADHILRGVCVPVMMIRVPGCPVPGV